MGHPNAELNDVYDTQPVPRALVEEILALASRSPSGVNTQPWLVRLLSAGRCAQLIAQTQAAWPQIAQTQAARLYAATGSTHPIPDAADDQLPAPSAQTAAAFDAEWQHLVAPVSGLCLIDSRMGRGSWLDYGMFLQTWALACAERGLLLQTFSAWQLADAAAQALGIAQAHERVLCGFTLGFPREPARLQAPALFRHVPRVVTV